MGKALQTSAAREGIVAEDLMCTRDYSVACPLGWSDLGDGSQCLAPANYAGACSKTTSFGKMPSEKSGKAAECATLFPCLGLPQDYTKACPATWTQDFHGCVAPADYEGPCLRRKSFAGYSVIEKMNWGQRCGVFWPNRQSI